MKILPIACLFISSVCSAQTNPILDYKVESVQFGCHDTAGNSVYAFHLMKDGENPNITLYDELEVRMDGKTYHFKIKGYVSEFIDDTGKVTKFPIKLQPAR